MNDLSDDLPPFVYVPCELPPADVATMMPMIRPLDAGGTGLIFYSALDRMRRGQGRDVHWAVLDLSSLKGLQELRQYDAFLIDDGHREGDRGLVGRSERLRRQRGADGR